MSGYTTASISLDEEEVSDFWKEKNMTLEDECLRRHAVIKLKRCKKANEMLADIQKKNIITADDVIMDGKKIKTEFEEIKEEIKKELESNIVNPRSSIKESTQTLKIERNVDEKKSEIKVLFQSAESQLLKSSQNQDRKEFQTNINFFTENKMHQDVLIHLMKDFISKDLKNKIFLKEFIKLKDEKEMLSSQMNKNQQIHHKQNNVIKIQDQDVSDFQCNIGYFKANKMDKDVFIHLMKRWTANDFKKNHLLNEFINLKNEIEHLHQLEKEALNVSDINFENENAQMNIKREVKNEVEEIDIT